MKLPKIHVSDCMSSVPLFVNTHDSLQEAVTKLERFSVSKITVIDKDFNVKGMISKTDIKNFLVSKDISKESASHFLKNQQVKDVMNSDSKFVLAYPGCNLKEIYGIMNTIKTKYLPIVKSPWNKKLEGFIKLDETFFA